MKTKTFGALRASTLAALCVGGIALTTTGCRSGGDKGCGQNSCGSNKSAEKGCSGQKSCSGEKSCSGQKGCGQNSCGKK